MKADPATRLAVERNRAALARFHSAVNTLIGMLIVLLPLAYLDLYQVVIAIPFLFLSPDAAYTTATVIFPIILYGISGIVVFIIARFLLQEHWLACPICGKRTAVLHDWVCGDCTKEHSDFRAFWRHSFLESCVRCNKKPPGLICYSCREPILFEDREGHYAWLPGYPPIEQVVRDEERPPRPIDIHLR